MKKQLPGRFQHTLAVLAALLLAACLLLTALCQTFSSLLTDAELHAAVAADDSLIQAQLQRIRREVEELSALQPFDPDAVMSLITPDGLRQYNLGMSAWWLGLVKPEPSYTPPEWDVEALQEAVRADPVFQEAVSSTQRRTVARDEIAYPIGQIIRRTVMPIRTDLVAIAMPRVAERVDIPRLANLLAQSPLLLCGLCVVLAALILLCLRRSLCRGGLLIGSALSAAGLVTFLLLGGVMLLDPCAIIAQASELLALEAGLLGQQLCLRLSILAGVQVLLGAACIWTCGRNRSHAA